MVTLRKTTTKVAQAIENQLIFNALGNGQQIKSSAPFNNQLHNFHINRAIEHIKDKGFVYFKFIGWNIFEVLKR